MLLSPLNYLFPHFQNLFEVWKQELVRFKIRNTHRFASLVSNQRKDIVLQKSEHFSTTSLIILFSSPFYNCQSKHFTLTV